MTKLISKAQIIDIESKLAIMEAHHSDISRKRLGVPGNSDSDKRGIQWRNPLQSEGARRAVPETDTTSKGSQTKPEAT